MRAVFTADDVGTFWKDAVGHVWTVESYCASPTVTLRKLDNQEKKSGAVGSLLFDRFEKLTTLNGISDDALANEIDRRWPGAVIYNP